MAQISEILPDDDYILANSVRCVCPHLIITLGTSLTSAALDDKLIYKKKNNSQDIRITSCHGNTRM